MIATMEQMTAAATDWPGPGIYEGIPFEDYLRWPFVSNSSLQPAERSMLHYHARPIIEETPAMRLGTLCHLGRHEPSALFRKYVVMPDLTGGILTKGGELAKSPRSTAEYADRVAKWEEQNAGGKIVIPQSDLDAMTGMVAMLDQHPIAHEWFTAPGPVEVSIVWDDYETGIRCKGRIDKLVPGKQLVVDLKSVRDCLKFPSAIADRSYHRQGGMYTDGYATLTGELFGFGLVAVENEHPYGVMAAPLSAADVDLGREEYQTALRQIAAARKSNHWQGYESPAEWSLPGWRRPKSETTDEVVLTFRGAQVTV